MTNRQLIYNSLRLKMEEVGFQFEEEQKPHFQNQRKAELKFVHPQLIKKWKEEGYNIRAQKFYIKPLSDDQDCEIGFVTGKSSPLNDAKVFIASNSYDSFDDSPSWTNRDSDLALDNLLISIKNYLGQSHFPSEYNRSRMNTFLLVWNPNKWNWDDLQEKINHLETIGYVEDRWNCGNTKSIKKGDRVFLMRLGKEPKGIMGSGYAKSSYYVAPHWDKIEGKTTNYIDIEFDILINPSNNILFGKEFLESIDSNNIQQWFPQQSGITIKDEIVDVLESSWFNFIRENKYLKKSFVLNDLVTDNNDIYREGKSIEMIQTRYERNPQARKVCLNRHGYSCKVCDFSFEQYFGEIGKSFIHVHHINSIAEIGGEYDVDPIKDLIPVCPNCHAMIHLKRPSFTIEEIKEIRKTTNNN